VEQRTTASRTSKVTVETGTSRQETGTEQADGKPWETECMRDKDKSKPDRNMQTNRQNKTREPRDKQTRRQRNKEIEDRYRTKPGNKDYLCRALPVSAKSHISMIHGTILSFSRSVETLGLGA
jgi:hypothetical protein